MWIQLPTPLPGNTFNDSVLAPYDAVRVEEFINYFDYEYPTPEGVAFGVWADGAPSPFHTDGTYFLRIGIQGYEIPEEERMPASLTFIIDVSGSMDKENRLGLVKYSLQQLVDQLRSDDTVAIVAYGTQARIVLYPTSGSEKDLILNAIYSLSPSGSTNAEEGLEIGYQLASQTYDPERINRVILCSDGVANVGKTTAEKILRQVERYANDSITLTSFGFGMGNFNDTLLEQLADNGNGNYAYIDNAEEAQEYFIDGLTGVLQTIAYDAKVQVDFNEDVVARYRLVGYENRAVADENSGMMLLMQARSMPDTAQQPSMQSSSGRMLPEGLPAVQLRWKDQDGETTREINGNINTWDFSTDFEESDPNSS